MEKKFTYFISSTFKDLIEERKAVANYVLKIDEIPIGMEQFGSVDRTPWDHITRLIDTADYFILIIAGAYGSIDKTDPERLSYTHKEFRYARDSKIPIIGVIHRTPTTLPNAFSETDPERVQKLAEFRQEVSESRLVAYYTNEHELMIEIAASISKGKAIFRRPGWVRNIDLVSTKLLRIMEEEHDDAIKKLEKEHKKEIEFIKATVAINDPGDLVQTFNTALADTPTKAPSDATLRRKFFEQGLNFPIVYKYDDKMWTTRMVTLTRAQIFYVIAKQIVEGEVAGLGFSDANYKNMTLTALGIDTPTAAINASDIKPATDIFVVTRDLSVEAQLIYVYRNQYVLSDEGAELYTLINSGFSVGGQFAR